MLTVEHAVVRFGDATVVDGVDLTVGAGETVAILGPSGCGKTTLLRAIAGLQPLTSGRVLWAGDDLAAVPPHRRRFGLMFQEYTLFPHRDVAGNVAFGLRMAGVGRDERAAACRGGARSRWPLGARGPGGSWACRAGSSSGSRWRAPSPSNPGC